MSVSFCGLSLAHPVINGSGTFDAIAARRAFGAALDEHFPFAAFVSKTITLEPRAGNPPPRLWEAPAGLINSIGLPNRGLHGYLTHELPELARLNVPLITNVMGSSAQEIAQLLEACDRRREIAAVELNVSCPNVKTGLDIGSDPRELERVVGAVRRSLGKPLIVKLTPNCADVAACARAAEEGGADAVSLINTLRAMAPAPPPGRTTTRTPSPPGRAAPRTLSSPADGEPGATTPPADGEPGAGAPPVRPPPRAWLAAGTGGLSGPAVRAVALAQVAAVAERVSVPVVGMGGIQTASHARQFLDVGATLVAVGTETFREPLTAARIAAELTGA